MATITYPLDTTGQAASNKISGEQHLLTEVNSQTYRILIPSYSPFYLTNFKLEHVNNQGVARTLVADVDYYLCLPYIGATRSIGKVIYGGVAINSQLVDGTLRVTYQTLGGVWTADPTLVRQALAEKAYNPRITVWDTVTDKPNQFPPINHTYDASDIAGLAQLVASFDTLASAVRAGPDTTSGAIRHFVRTDNPHATTKAQVGLGLVQNYDTATTAEINAKTASAKYVLLSQVLALLGGYIPKTKSVAYLTTNARRMYLSRR